MDDVLYVKSKETQLPSNTFQWGWFCVGNKPTRWGLGKRVDDHLEDALAYIERLPSGQWQWDIVSSLFVSGIEPSMDTAMETSQGFLIKHFGPSIELEGGLFAGYFHHPDGVSQ